MMEYKPIKFSYARCERCFALHKIPNSIINKETKLQCLNCGLVNEIPEWFKTQIGVKND